jgi:hypothetical protein
MKGQRQNGTDSAGKSKPRYLVPKPIMENVKIAARAGNSAFIFMAESPPHG